MPLCANRTDPREVCLRIDARSPVGGLFEKQRERERARLFGVQAVVCPPDEKLLHGMADAVLIPCSVSRETGHFRGE